MSLQLKNGITPFASVFGQGQGKGKGSETETESTPASPRRTYDRSTHKRCMKCKKVKPLEQYGNHDDTDDGKQSYCYECKNVLGKRRRNKNVRARLRHHFSTRIAVQLGSLCPPDITQSLETYLGYTMKELSAGLSARLIRDFPEGNLKLRDVLNDGWHVDHIYPLSKFNVLSPGSSVFGQGKGSEKVVDWEEFRKCWAIDNLRAIPAEENLKKGARVAAERKDGVPF